MGINLLFAKADLATSDGRVFCNTINEQLRKHLHPLEYFKSLGDGDYAAVCVYADNLIYQVSEAIDPSDCVVDIFDKSESSRSDCDSARSYTLKARELKLMKACVFDWLYRAFGECQSISTNAHEQSMLQCHVELEVLSFNQDVVNEEHQEQVLATNKAINECHKASATFTEGLKACSEMMRKFPEVEELRKLVSSYPAVDASRDSYLSKLRGYIPVEKLSYSVKLCEIEGDRILQSTLFQRHKLKYIDAKMTECASGTRETSEDFHDLERMRRDAEAAFRKLSYDKDQLKLKMSMNELERMALSSKRAAVDVCDAALKESQKFFADKR